MKNVKSSPEEQKRTKKKTYTDSHQGTLKVGECFSKDLTSIQPSTDLSPNIS